MKVFFYARPADNGFSRSPATICRVEIVQLYHPVLGKNIYQWCQYGEACLENITTSDISIENIHHAADVLATEQGWTLLTELDFDGTDSFGQRHTNGRGIGGLS